MMKILLYSAVTVGLLSITGCTPKYNVDESNELVATATADSVQSQQTYSRMIKTLEKGYSYMRGRLAGAALERNPSEAINDIINMMNDSTLNAVQHHSGILISILDSAKLDKQNARSFEKVRAKYRELEASLLPDTTVSVSR